MDNKDDREEWRGDALASFFAMVVSLSLPSPFFGLACASSISSSKW